MSRLKFSEFGMEATGHYWLSLYAHLRQAGQSVHVINPLQSDALRVYPSDQERHPRRANRR
ncbi:MAG: transposase [Selenomonadaceae bacterium]|nr:transposase [Selenomonadaceae bacterium]